MSQEQKDAELGRAYRRHEEIVDELKALSLVAQRLGRAFVDVGNALQNAPQNLVFNGESVSSPFRADYSLSKANQDYVSVDRLRKLTREFRRLLNVKSSLEAILERR